MSREKKFTPGPWKYLKGNELDWDNSQFELGSHLWGCIEVAPKRYITVEGRSHIEAKANANLVAAAPELLSSLEEMTELVKNYHKDCGGCDHSVGICYCGEYAWLDEAEKAIAKAYGEK